jgi:hypothetical protein
MATTCVVCGRDKTKEDKDYDPMQVLTGQPVGWYSGEDGEVCPEDMTRLLAGHFVSPAEMKSRTETGEPPEPHPSEQ